MIEALNDRPAHGGYPGEVVASTPPNFSSAGGALVLDVATGEYVSVMDVSVGALWFKYVMRYFPPGPVDAH